MKTLSLSALISTILLAVSCSTNPKVEIPDASLSLPLATERSQVITQVQYDLLFSLKNDSDSFEGVSEISFNYLKTSSKSLKIDFNQGTVNSTTINGQKSPFEYDGERIVLNTTDLKVGKNTIVISFKQKYSKDGSGLYKFVDPEDRRIYLYSNLEPYGANRVFPCFDQPDMKARFKMKVNAPKGWSVVSYAREIEKTSSANNILWTFPESELISTYVWSLHAGPFYIWVDAAKSKYPLRLFARQSLMEHVQADFWFKITRQGFSYFEKYFNRTYPYKKYDQLIVPDFNAGAMENVAAVTFTEKYITRGKKSRAQERDLASVILHEMAHMWFGNLVTMKWWNDLWLNESFATYMAAKAMASATQFSGEEAWRDFYDMKTWAFSEDSSVTTHPIEALINNTKDAFTNFDGITYGKGASLLKQLDFYLGESTFREGVRNYFRIHAGKNTTRKDFIDSLARASSVNLEGWTQQWLQTAGINRLTPQIQCNSRGRIEDFYILQDPPIYDDKITRPQKSMIALYYEKNVKAGVGLQKTLEIKGERTSLSQLKNISCPLFIDINHEDHGYGLFSLDPASFDYFSKNGGKLQSPYLRQRIWTSLWHDLLEGKISLGALARLASEAFAQEKDPVVLNELGQMIYGRRPNSTSMYSFWPKEDPSNLNIFFVFVEELEKTIWERLKKATPGSEIQKVLFKALHRSSLSPFGIDRMKLILDNKVSFKGLKIEQDDRWLLISSLARAGDSEALKRVEEETNKDKGSRGLDSALSAQASFGEESFIKKWREELLSPNSTATYAQFKLVWGALYPPLQESARNANSERFFKDLETLIEKKPGYVLRAFSYTGPNACAKSDRETILRILEDKDLEPSLSKALKMQHQEGEQCERIRSRF
ncbi:aminopeptidase N [bacterium]|nr:aminopeptidase N [bacterium]